MIKYKKNDEVYNYCSKYLARSEFHWIHDYDYHQNSSFSDHILESWRFPVIDSFFDEGRPVESSNNNDVTFIWCDFDGNNIASSVSVLGSFNNYDLVPLRRVNDSIYHSVTIEIPKNTICKYKFVVDESEVLDPINPQREGGWSRFFTENCSSLLTLTTDEVRLLTRLTMYILPFRLNENECLVSCTHDLNSNDSFEKAESLELNLGIVNFIDKILSREERHHLINYRICLKILRGILDQLDSGLQFYEHDQGVYELLFKQMMSNVVPNWDYQQYNNPRFFIELLRRHTFTGAFSHPKYGGNLNARGWDYLSNRYVNNLSETLFDWKRSLEKPLGSNAEYRA